MQIIIILLLILAVLLVIFTLQNSMDISLNVFFWEIANVPLVLVLICCVVFGYILASIYFYPRLWKTKKEYKQLIKFNDELKELHELNHKKEQLSEEETNPEGIKLDDDDDGDSFFKD
jgi:putative membrane protein